MLSKMMQKTKRSTPYHDLSILKKEIIDDLEETNYQDFIRGEQVLRENQPFVVIYVDDGLGDDPSLHYAPVSVEGYEELKEIDGISVVTQVDNIRS